MAGPSARLDPGSLTAGALAAVAAGSGAVAGTLASVGADGLSALVATRSFGISATAAGDGAAG